MKDATLNDPTSKRLLVCISVFSNLLFAATWRLWIPPLQGNWSDEVCYFPRIPLSGALRNWPGMLDYGLLGVAIGASWGILIFQQERWQLVARWIFVLGCLGLMLTNQHRIQPWLYQLCMLCLMRIVLAPSPWVRFARWQLVSIYLFSAWSKLDYTFVHSLGQQFVDIVLAPWGEVNLSPTARIYLALVFPVGELLVGLGLIAKRTRRTAAIAALFLHLALIGILGPWGLNHHPGVLVWNAQFVAMNLILFVLPQPCESNAMKLTAWKRYLSWAILLLPLLETAGLLDHWPAWQLYAPRNSRAKLMLLATEANLAQVPALLHPFLAGDETSLYRSVDLDSWSLESLNVPIYPQDRFQVGVAIDFLQRCDLMGAGKVTIEGPAQRWTGKRKQTVLRGTEEIRYAAHSFRLNALPGK